VQLNQARVVDAAVTLVGDRGFDALGVRSVAGALGVTPMALYRHVGSAEQLTDEVVARIVERIPVPAGRGRFADRAGAWAVAARQALTAHPGTAAHLLTHWFEIPAALERVDRLLAAAEEEGWSGFDAVAVANAVFTYVLMRVQAEEAVRRAGVVHRHLADTPDAAERYPRVVVHSREYTTARLDAHFRFGLDALLAGFPAVA
jgi:AcrR family transcriptional regulator